MQKPLYTNKQMFEITGEKKPRIQYWILKSVFEPADEGSGIGTSRRYSFGNLLEILIARSLARVLNNVAFIANIIKEVRKNYPSFFKDTLTQRSPVGKNILSVVIQSDNAIIPYIHNLKMAKQCLDTYLKDGMKIFHMDLDVLKADLLMKLGNIEKKNR